MIHREACGRQPEHHDREVPRHERAGGRVAGKEAFQIAGRAIVVADNEPRDVVEDVMEPGDDQEAVEESISEQPEIA